MFGLRSHGQASDLQPLEGAHHELAGHHSAQGDGHRAAQRAPCGAKRVGKINREGEQQTGRAKTARGSNHRVGFGRREAQRPPQTASSGGESRGIGKDG